MRRINTLESQSKVMKKRKVYAKYRLYPSFSHLEDWGNTKQLI